MHYRLGTISLAATTLLISLTSPLLPLGGFKPLAAQAQTSQDQKVKLDSAFQAGVEQFQKGQLQQALATFQQVLAQSRGQGDKLGEAEALSGIGEVYIFGLHPTTEALNVLQEALAIYQTLENFPQTQFRRKQGEARTIALIGLAYDRLNQKDEALQHLQQALTIQREIGDKAGTGKTLNYLANLAIADYTNTDLNRLKEALELLQQALVINRDVGNLSNETVSLGLLGWGHNRLGDNPQALKFLNEALTKSRENGYRLWEGQALLLMTLVYNTQGSTEQAIASAQQALSILEAVGSPWTSDALFLLGVNYQKQQQHSQALEYYQQALTIARKIDNRTSEGNILNHIGIVYNNQQNYESALSYYQQALAIHREVKNHSVEIATLNNIGFIYQKQKQYAQAREYYEQVLAVAKQTDNPPAQANALLNISYTYSFPGDELLQASSIQQALEAYQQTLKYAQSALTIAQNLPNSEQTNSVLSGVAQAYMRLGFAYGAQKQYSEAMTAFEQALDFAQQAGNQQTEFNALLNLANNHISPARTFIAAEEFQQASAMLQQGLEYGQQAVKLAQNDEQKRNALQGIGNIYAGMRELYDAQEEYPKAIEASQQTLAVTRQLSKLPNGNSHASRSLEATTLAVIAGYYSQLSQYRQALELQQQALSIVREIDELYWEELFLRGIGKTYTDLGQYSKARDYSQQALAIAKQQGWLLSQASILNNLGTINLAQGDYTRALEHFQQALQIAQDVHRRVPTEAPNTLAQICPFSSGNNQTSNSPTYLVDQFLENRRNNCLKLSRGFEANTLNNIGLVYDNQGRYQQALESYQQSLTIDKQLKNRGREATTLLNIGTVYVSQGEYAKALEFNQQALEIQTAIGDRYGEMVALNNIGMVYSYWGRYAQALEFYQKALAIAIEIDTPSQEATTLDNIGGIYSDQGNYRQSMEYRQQALAIRRKIGDRSGELNSLNNIGYIRVVQGRYPEALEFYQQSLTIAVEIGERSAEATALNNIGGVYDDQGNISQSLEYYQKALAIRREIGDRSGEMISLNNIGSIHASQGRYPEALEFFQQSLAIATEIGDRKQEATILSNRGGVYDMQGNISQSRKYYQQALFIRTEIGDRTSVANSLHNIGMSYYYQGEYAKALELFQQALTTITEIGERRTEAQYLNNLGELYSRLGQYRQAMEYRQQALAIAQEIGHRTQEVRILNGIGNTYERQQRYTEALEPYQQALTIAREIGDRSTEGNILTNIGNLYKQKGEPTQASAFLQQALAIFQDIGVPSGEGQALRGLGRIYAALNQDAQALQSYQQAITIQRELGYRPEESQTFSDLGKLLAQQNQPELAIVFFKQAVNIRESIRGNLRPLSEELQQSYTQTIADSYRQLAEILLQQDRVLEAQEVLDLLKLQELEDYLRNVRGNLQTAQKLDFWQPEQRILALYDQWIEQKPDAQFQAFVNNPEVTALVTQLRRTARGQNLNPDQLVRLQDNLQSLDHAALLYPLILEDQVELVLVTPTSLVRKTVELDRVKLNEAIANFRSDITNPSSNPIPNAQQLYQWLIQPIENDLEQAQVNTILYAADGQLRYIPLSALHDGEQWLIQRFTLNHITAASLTNFNRNGTRPLQILAAAYSDPQLSYQFQIGEDQFNFTGLKFAGVEVETIAQEIPGTTAFFNKDFNRDNVEPRLGKHSIVHLATHAEFVSGLPYESFILFGSGERVTLADIDQWQLPNVDLVVLSACRTATSGKLGNGEEILGFGYQIQRTGSQAAIASLWYVSDGGTQALMNTFYGALQTGTLTKAEALQQAQVALITGDYQKVLEEQRGVGVEQRINNNQPSQVKSRLSHPYYWAPFILIGNGL